MTRYVFEQLEGSLDVYNRVHGYVSIDATRQARVRLRPGNLITRSDCFWRGSLHPGWLPVARMLDVLKVEVKR